jgi:GDPmannose 4,6-dehydratase
MTALIFGISGQDGSLLANFLLGKGYHVIGITRNIENNKNLKLLNILKNIRLIVLDEINLEKIIKIIQENKPTEIYNLSGQTSVGKSLVLPFETFNSSFNLTLSILEAIKIVSCKIKYFNASSTECFGSSSLPFNEKSGYTLLSPYASAKASTHLLVNSYKKNYGIFVCTGILSNHESYFRSANFVAKKVVESAFNIYLGKQNVLEVGDISIIRDWGWAEEYVEAMYLIMQQSDPKDYIIATGKSISLEEFIKYTFNAYDLNYKKYVRHNNEFKRPNEIQITTLNTTKINKEIGWKPKVDVFGVIDNLIKHQNLEL